MSLPALSRQRERWHRGFSECLWRHRRLFANPRYGVLGTVVYPAFLIFEWLAPMVEVAGLALLVAGLLLGMVNHVYAVLFLTLSLGLGLLLSLLALLLEEQSFRRYGTVRDRAMLVVYALVEMVGYRQLTLYWRLRGIANFIRGKRNWGAMKRQGFDSDSRRQQPATPVVAPQPDLGIVAPMPSVRSTIRS